MVKLKQVDHVNHERSVLADVAGHPFITSLITSFSDYDSLYMLVSESPKSICSVSNLTDLPSLIIALAAKFSHIYEKRNGSTKIRRDFTRPKSF